MCPMDSISSTIILFKSNILCQLTNLIQEYFTAYFFLFFQYFSILFLAFFIMDGIVDSSTVLLPGYPGCFFNFVQPPVALRDTVSKAQHVCCVSILWMNQTVDSPTFAGTYACTTYWCTMYTIAGLSEFCPKIMGTYHTS